MAAGEIKPALRLMADGKAPPPCGFVIARKAADALLEKLYIRLAHYASLRIAATPDDLVFLAPPQTDLPWHPDIRFFFYESGPALLPTGFCLDLPARWRDEVVSRLSASLGQALPVLLMPPQDGAALLCLGLGDAKPLIDVDLPRLAGERAA